MTTGIGPWFAPTIVLVAGTIYRFFYKGEKGAGFSSSLVLTQAIGSVGGSVATAIGFSLTTLYFLEKDLFLHWISSPYYFSFSLGFFTLGAGLLGSWLGRVMKDTVIRKSALSFPVSTVIYESIASQSQKSGAGQLAIGAFFAALIGVARDGFLSLKPFIQKRIQVFSFLSAKHFSIDTMPIYWSIGYLAGPMIVTPLIVGLVSKYLVVWPLNNHARFFPYALFQPLRSIDFTLAFCSGIVLVLALVSLKNYPLMLIKALRSYGGVSGVWRNISGFFKDFSFKALHQNREKSGAKVWSGELLVALCMIIASLWYLDFSPVGMFLLIAMTLLADYQLALFAARTGLATYGRFMTFVMIPLLLLCRTSDMQTTLACVFVGVVGAVAANLLFSYKVADHAGVSHDHVHKAHLLGLVASSLCVGLLFWLIVTSFEIGSPSLVAHRGLTRALLLQSFNFNYVVLLMGGMFGLLLRFVRINPMLVFGGLVMPNSMIIGLAIGAGIRGLAQKVETYVPFWSGVFAGYSLWMFVVMLTALWR